MNVHLRWMIRRDMPEVLAIEAEAFQFPWSERDFIACFRQRNCIGMVAEHNEAIVGFFIYELHKTRLGLLNFAVDHRYRNQGVGRQMVAKLLDKLSQQRRSRVEILVRETNLSAQQFFAHLGFRAVSIVRNRYDDTDEDAYRFVYRVRETARV